MQKKNALKPQVRSIIDSKGPDAAILWGRKNGMKEATIIFYVKEHLDNTGNKIKSKILDEIARNKSERVLKKVIRSKKVNGSSQLKKAKDKRPLKEPPKEIYSLNYCYASVDEARDRRAIIARRTGIPADCFRIVKKGALYAVGPKHYDPTTTPPTFEKGDRVIGLGYKRLGIIKDPGPQQSLVTWEDGLPQIENNHYLHLHKESEPLPKVRKVRKSAKKTN